jgi:glycine/D-amino acid oxidase-like deaminating enzyme
LPAHYLGHEPFRRREDCGGIDKGVGLRTSRYEYAVVGGGIAGLAVAEIFARSGKNVVLIERNDHLCQEASAAQHGWFHFGSLYSIFPQNQFLRTMIGGVEDLLEYYRGFPGMNITLTNRGHLAFPQANGAWFRDEPIEYIVCARNDADFDMRSFNGLRDYTKKLFLLITWEMAIKQFISRHQRFHKHDWAGTIAASQWIPCAGWMDYSREVITKPNNPSINLDRDTHFRIVGHDRPMRAAWIISDLIRSFLGAGGEVKTGTAVEQVVRVGKAARLETAVGSIEANTVIVAAGRWLGGFLKHAEGVKVVSSPLLVVYPAVSKTNFVRMTPFVEKSINHLNHEINGLSYSLIGGGHFADPEDAEAVARASERLLAMARTVFPNIAGAKVLEAYLGCKTEIVPRRGERNYQYFIRKVNDGMFILLPGKFSLAFSLAVNAYKRLIGEEPARHIRLAREADSLSNSYLMRHAALVQRTLRNPALSSS